MKLPQTILIHAGKKVDREMAEAFGLNFFEISPSFKQEI